VYYGTEVGMAGPTHENRKEMQWGKNPELTERFRQLSGARAASQALQVGRQQELQAGPHTYAFSRMLPEEEVICAFNNSDEPKTVTLPLHPDSQIPDGAVLQDMLGQGEAVLGPERTLEVTLPARGFHYLQWKE
jgi:glycosidase